MLVFFMGQPLLADFHAVEDANYSLVRAKTTITVKADGSYRMDDTSTYRAQNDQGRLKLSQHSHPFLPETSQVRILWAKVKTGDNTFNVDLKNLENRELPSPSGLSSARQLIIPFTHVQVGSEVSYRSITQNKNKLIPGYFSMRFIYGLMFPELEGEVTLVSDKPLYHAVRDPGKYLKVTEGKDGQKHTLKITLLKQAFFIPKNEAGMVLDPATFPTVDVSTAKDWNELAKPLAQKYENVLKQPLPPLFKAIAEKAETAPTEAGKAQIIISELAEKITYSGNWTTLVKAMFPRGHAEVAKTQNGDCKDYSSTAVAILRSLGIKATVALVQRESPQSPSYLLSRSAVSENPLPMLGYFNHAIVRMVTKDGKVLWFDPTNPVSQNLAPFQDIARSIALNLSSDVNAAEVLPAEHDPDNKGTIDIVVKPRLDGTADFTADLNFSGQVSTSLRAEAMQSGKNALEEQLWTLLLVKPVQGKKQAGDYDIKTRAYKPLKIPLTATIDSPLQDSKEVKDGKADQQKLIVPLPLQALVFAMIGRDRKSALYLGTPAEWTITRTIHGVDTPDEVAGDCFALSKWMDLRRKTYKVPEGLKIEDHFTLKESFIQAKEFKGKEVGYFAGNIFNCFDVQTLEASWYDPNNKEQAASRRIIEKTMSLQEGIEFAKKKKKRSDNLRALRIFEHLVSQGNSEAQAWIAMPIRFLGYLSGYDYQKDYLAAAKLEAEKAIALDANSPVAHQQKTRNLMYSKEFVKARASFATAFKLQPQHFETFMLGGDLFELENKIDFAEKSYLKALSLAETSIDKSAVYGKLASINAERAPQNAISYYKASLDITPDDVWLMNNLAVVYNRLGQWDQAIAILEKALKISQFGMAESNLANAYAGKATQIIRQSPGSPENIQQAEVLAMKALKLDQTEHKARGTLGVIYLHLAKKNQDGEALARSMEYFQATFAGGYSNSWLLGHYNAAQAMHLSQQMDKTRKPASQP